MAQYILLFNPHNLYYDDARSSKGSIRLRCKPVDILPKSQIQGNFKVGQRVVAKYRTDAATGEEDWYEAKILHVNESNGEFIVGVRDNQAPKDLILKCLSQKTDDCNIRLPRYRKGVYKIPFASLYDDRLQTDVGTGFSSLESLSVLRYKLEDGRDGFSHSVGQFVADYGHGEYFEVTPSCQECKHKEAGDDCKVNHTVDIRIGMFRTEMDKYVVGANPIAVGFREKTDGSDYRILRMNMDGRETPDSNDTHMICRDTITLEVGKTYLLKPLAGEIRVKTDELVNLVIYYDRPGEAKITMTRRQGTRLKLINLEKLSYDNRLADRVALYDEKMETKTMRLEEVLKCNTVTVYRCGLKFDYYGNRIPMWIERRTNREDDPESKWTKLDMAMFVKGDHKPYVLYLKEREGEKRDDGVPGGEHIEGQASDEVDVRVQVSYDPSKHY